MDRRTFLAILLIMAVLVGDQILWSRWTHRGKPATSAGPGSTATVPGDTSAASASMRSSQSPAPTGANGGQPVATASHTSGGPHVPPSPATTAELRGDPYFDARFTSQGGAISGWSLPHYKDLIRREESVDLVGEGQRAIQVVVTTPYFAYDFSNVPFRLAQSSDNEVSFVAEDTTGVKVTKTYRRSKNPHSLDVEVRVSVPPQYGPIQFRWGWANALPITERNAMPRQNQAVALIGDRLESMDSTRLQKQGPKTFSGNVRWVADRGKYFVAALIPDSATVDAVQFAATADGHPAVWLTAAAPPGTEVIRHARLYAGPVHYNTLVAQGADLDRLANLGWRWLKGFSALLLWCLNALYKWIPNYGLGIILLSAATKLVFYPLTQASFRSMKVMHHLQPEVKSIQDRFKDDPAAMNKAMMELYKRYNVNPLSGCLPMLVQVPVFFALYNVFLNSIELRGAGFLGYIQDLSVPDNLMSLGGFTLHLMPIIMTGSTYLMQTQTPVAPQQRPMMMLMPVMMLVFMYNFPAGVVLYWTVNNVLSAIQQYLANAAEDRKMAASA